MNWLRVLGTAELSQIDQGVRHQFHAKMSLLHVFKPEQQPLEFVLPRKGSIHTSSPGLDDFIEQTLSPALRVLSMARILVDVGALRQAGGRRPHNDRLPHRVGQQYGLAAASCSVYKPNTPDL
jgi:hypothetical protein